METGIIENSLKMIIKYGNQLLLPVMVSAFLVAIVFRILLWYHLKREEAFAVHFQKKVDRFLDKEEKKQTMGFFSLAKRMLLVTYYEVFEKRSLLQRRKHDPIMAFSDRVFLIKQGYALLVKDVLRQIRHLKPDAGAPAFLEIAKTVFEKNPCFTRIFGILPGSLINDVLNILPGLFIVGGIFGTFVGIMEALPELSGIKLDDYEGTKMIMDLFLVKMAFAMNTSILGIVLNVAMSLLNAAFSPQKVFVRTVERFENSLHLIWNRCDHNDFVPMGPAFEDNKDPVEALAEQALDQEYTKAKRAWTDEKRQGGSDKPEAA